MSSNINPTLEPTKSLDKFRFWCQKVLPLVYDDSLSYYEVLGKMVVQLNDVIDNVNADTENVLTLKDAFLELQTYVNNFFDDIDQLASYAERAEAAQTAANTSAVNAATSASNASQSSLAAMDARDTAVAARQAAQTSANNASTAATNANTKASEAAQSAITAQTAQASASQSATLAATDRSAAQTAASTATTKANEANTSATNAETSAANAAQSEANAEELVNNIQENLDNIQQNTQDISDLKESMIEFGDVYRITNSASNPFIINSGEKYVIQNLANINVVFRTRRDQFGTNVQSVTVPPNSIEIFEANTDTSYINVYSSAEYNVRLIKYDTAYANNLIAIYTISRRILQNNITDVPLAVNSYVIAGGVFYRITAPIASGGTIIDGTNAAKTWINSELTDIRAALNI